MTSTLKLLPFPFPTDQLKRYDQPFLLSVPLYLLFLPVITASPLRTRSSFTTIQIISQILKSLQFAKSRREKRVEKFELGVVVTQIRRVCEVKRHLQLSWFKTSTLGISNFSRLNEIWMILTFKRFAKFLNLRSFGEKNEASIPQIRDTVSTLLWHRIASRFQPLRLIVAPG